MFIVNNLTKMDITSLLKKKALLESYIYSVSELTDNIKAILESNKNLINIWVRGEVSNISKPSSGHVYFTLKDNESQLLCVMFNFSDKFKLEHGMRILARGSIRVYERKGNYELVIDELREDGLGLLHQEFLLLKEKLEREGLFKHEHKRALPRFPSRIGIATSETGAALRDILKIIRKRYPIEVIISPCYVQGLENTSSIAKAIRLLQTQDIDVIIIARGGGSLEDLWCFNTEEVARAIFESRMPVVSAIGHETDFTIADFVADVRAPTPSAAAELVVPDKKEILNIIDMHKERLYKKIFNLLESGKIYIKQLMERPVFTQPYREINQYKQYIDETIIRLERNLHYFLKIKSKTLEVFKSKLNTLNPENVLKRGYSVTLKNDKVIKESKHVKIDDLIKIVLYKGEIKAIVIANAKKHTH